MDHFLLALSSRGAFSFGQEVIIHPWPITSCSHRLHLQLLTPNLNMKGGFFCRKTRSNVNIFTVKRALKGSRGLQMTLSYTFSL